MPILDQCSHQFVWPRRSADGRYYQVCRICAAEYEYDWETMQRVQHRENAGILDGEIQIADPEVTDTKVTDTEGLQHDAGLGPHVPVRREPATTQQAAVPRLLLDEESAYRVFRGNLTDFISRRTPRAVPTTSTPATFWNDVFLPSSVPWRRFAESLLGHVILVTLILLLVPRRPVGPVEKQSAFDKSYVSYYTPPKSFPALHSHSAKVQPKVNQTQDNQTHVNRQPIPEHRPAIKVAPEHASGEQEKHGQGEGITLPADLVSSRSGGLRLSGSHSPAPMMPLAATGGSQRRVPAAETWLVAPPADASLPTARGAGALQASAVAPAPEVAGVSSRRGNATVTAHAAVVAPAPSVSGAMRTLSDINIGESAVVKPAPQLPMSEQGTFSAMARGTLGGVGAVVVPPPPSVQSAGTLPGGRASLLAGPGSQVVPPAPSVPGASDVAGSARGRGLSGSGPQVVGPAPSLQGSGSGAGGGRMGSLSGGVEAVAPTPSIAGPGYGNGNGSGVGNGRGNSLSGAGLEGMPPSGKGTGTGADDLTGSGDSSTGSPSGSESGSGSSGTGSGTGPGGSASGSSSGQAGSGQGGTGTGTGTGSGNGSGTGSGLGPGESSSAAGRPHEPDTMEIPLRLIGPVLALPGSSYFSNYEVFIAERKRSKGELELIKLVYVSLPYQKRLAEYGPDNWTVPRLRVTRDQSCDESLMQMTWPETDPRPTSQPSADSPALSAKDRSGMLPCYRTTADDYRRALSRNH